MSGVRLREWRGGFDERAILVRWRAVGSWLEWMRRGIRLLILVSSEGVNIGGWEMGSELGGGWF